MVSVICLLAINADQGSKTISMIPKNKLNAVQKALFTVYAGSPASLS